MVHLENVVPTYIALNGSRAPEPRGIGGRITAHYIHDRGIVDRRISRVYTPFHSKHFSYAEVSSGLYKCLFIWLHISVAIHSVLILLANPNAIFGSTFQSLIDRSVIRVKAYPKFNKTLPFLTLGDSNSIGKHRCIDW